MRSLLIAALGPILLLGLATKSEASFHKRFQITKTRSGATFIKEKGMTTRFSVVPYVQFIKEVLLNEQAMMNSVAGYEQSIEEALFPLMWENGIRSSKRVSLIIRSLKSLGKLNIHRVFSHPIFQDIIAKFEGKLQKALSIFDPTVMAALKDSRFFYKRHVTMKVLRWALDQARKRLSQIPILNTLSYVLVQVERLINTRRVFHQNMLLYYLERKSEKELGLTKKEVNRAFSSIYEARIQWFNFWESRRAQRTWNRYGIKRFFSGVRAANNRLRNYRRVYRTPHKKINYAFRYAHYKGEKVIINLLDAQNMFNSRPAIAHYVNKPKLVARQRMIYTLANLGLSFVPLPSMFKNIGHRYFKSHYETQRLNEGGLHAYFEDVKNEKMRKLVLFQNLNPFEPEFQNLAH